MDPLYGFQNYVDNLFVDNERNQLFYCAIEKSIKKLQSQNENVHVLDIEAGPGLLSMMAVQAGANSVSGLHFISWHYFKIDFLAYVKYKSCAEKVIENNQMSDRIKVIPKSYDIKLEETEPKHNLVVNGQYGENLLSSFLDYSKEIKQSTSPNALCVPSRARIWIQLVQSYKLFNFHQFRKYFKLNKFTFKTPYKCQDCLGKTTYHYIQLNSLKPDQDFQILSDPIIALEFDFKELNCPLEKYKTVSVKLIRKFTKPVMLLSWWEFDLDDDGDIKLSYAPYWVRDESSSLREYLMQNIYYLPACAFGNERYFIRFNDIYQQQPLIITANYNYCYQYRFWFDIPCQELPIIYKQPWKCDCGFHIFSRSELFWINDVNRYKMYWRAMDKIIKRNRLDYVNIYFFGDASFLPVMFGHHPKVKQIKIVRQTKDEIFLNKIVEYKQLSKKIRIVKTNKSIIDFLERTNNSDNMVNILMTDFHLKSIQILIPGLSILFDRTNKILNPISLPNRIVFKALLVQLDDLWKIYGPIKKITLPGKELDMSAYDEMILSDQQSRIDCFKERYLWEYRSYSLLKKPIDLIEINVLQEYFVQLRQKREIEIDLRHLKALFNRIPMESVAIVIWVDCYLTDEDIISSLKFDFKNCNELPIHWELEWTQTDCQFVRFLFPRHLTENQWELLKKSDNPKLKLEFKLPIFNHETELKCDIE